MAYFTTPEETLNLILLCDEVLLLDSLNVVHADVMNEIRNIESVGIITALMIS